MNESRMLLKVGTESIKLSAEVAQKILINLLEKIKAEDARLHAEQLLEHLKNGGTIDVTLCRAFAAEDFSKFLDERGIANALGYDKETGLAEVLTKHEEREAVKKATLDFLIEQSRVTMIDFKEFTHQFAGKDVLRFQNVDMATVYEFTAASKKTDITFCYEKALEKGKYNIYVLKDDEEKAHKTMDIANNHLSGDNGPIAQSNAKVKDKQREDIETAINGKGGYYITSAHAGEYIKVTDDHFEYIRDFKIIRTKERSEEGFVAAFSHCYAGLQQPVLLTAEEWKQPSEARKNLVKNKVDKLYQEDRLKNEANRFKKFMENAETRFNGLSKDARKGESWENVKLKVEALYKVSVKKELDVLQHNNELSNENKTVDEKERSPRDKERVIEKKNDEKAITRGGLKQRRLELEAMARKLYDLKMSVEDSERKTNENSVLNSEATFTDYVDLEKLNKAEDREFVDALGKREIEEKILIAQTIEEKMALREAAEIHECFIDTDGFVFEFPNPEHDRDETDERVQSLERDEADIGDDIGR